MEGHDHAYKRHFMFVMVWATLNAVFWSFLLAFGDFYYGDAWPYFWMVTFWVITFIKAGMFIGHAVHSASHSMKPIEKTLGKVAGIIVILMSIVYWIFWTYLLFHNKELRSGWYLTYMWLWIFELVMGFGAPFIPMLMIVMIACRPAEHHGGNKEGNDYKTVPGQQAQYAPQPQYGQ